MEIKILIFSILVSTSSLLKAQTIKSKLDLTAGISAREYFHSGIRYQYSNYTQLGVYIGSDFEIRPNEKITTFSLDHMVHFGNTSHKTSRSVWFARQGYTYSVNKIREFETRRYSYVNLSLGRDFGINRWLGVNADFGLIWQFREYIEKTPTLETPINTLWRVFPLARIQFFISF